MATRETDFYGRPAPEYVIEASKDGEHRRRQARFRKGEESRWGIPFDPEVALREAIGFAEARGDDFPYVRVVIEIWPRPKRTAKFM